MLKTNIKHYLVVFLHGFISLQPEVPFFFFLTWFHFGHAAWFVGIIPWPGIEPRPTAVKVPSPYTGLPRNSREEPPLPFMAMWVPWWPIFLTLTYLKIPLFHLWLYLFYWSIQLIYSVVLFLLYSSDSVIHKYNTHSFSYFSYGLSQNIEYSSLCHTVSPLFLRDIFAEYKNGFISAF